MTIRHGALASSLLIAATPWAQPKPPEHARDFFGLDRIWNVELHVADAVWRGLTPRNPRFRGVSMRGAFSYGKADVVIAGLRLGGVGIRFKGNSTYVMSRGSLKRSFKLDFNRYRRGQRFLGLRKLNLQNNRTDPTHLREAVSYEAFRAAGIPVPRVCYARCYLTVPGRYDRSYLGLYTVVEQVSKRFVARHFGGKGSLLLKPENRMLPVLGEVWSDAHDAAYIPKTTVDPRLGAVVIRLADLVANPSDKEFAAGIAGVLDVEQFLRFVASCVLLGNYDSPLSLPHNYYLVVPSESERVVWLPWDLNLSLGGFRLMGAHHDVSVMQPSRLPLLVRLLEIPEYAALYRKTLVALLDGPCSAEAVGKQVDTAQRTIAQALAAEPAEGGFRRMFGGDAQGAKDFMRRREESARAQLAGKAVGRRAGFGRFGFGRRVRPGRRARDTFEPRTALRGVLARSLEWPGPGARVAPGEVLAAARRSFARLDADGSDGLSSRELKSAGLAATAIEWIVREMDRDGDRRITQREWLALLEVVIPRWDLDGNGKYDRREIEGTRR